MENKLSPRVGRSLRALLRSVLILSLLTLQGTVLWASPTVNAITPDASTGSQMTSTVSTSHVTVQLVFPDSADPGETVTISATVTAKSSGKIVSLSIDVYSYVNNQLVESASQTIATDKAVQSGDSWQSSLSVGIPTDAERGPLIGTVTEVWQEASNYYSSDYSSNYYPNYYSNYYSAYCSNYYRNYYPNYANTQTVPQTTSTSPTYPITTAFPAITHPDNYTAAMQRYLNQQRYVNQPRYVYQPHYQLSYVCEPAPYYYPNYGQNYSPNYGTQVSSEETLPLTYVLATTPEYLELQKTNDQLQKDNNDLVAQQNDLSSKYDSLKANYDQTVAKSNQLQSDYNSADQELANYKTFTYVLIVLAAVLAAAMVFIAAFQRRRVKGA